MSTAPIYNQVPHLVQGSDGIRRFSDSRIQQAVDEALSAADPDDSLVVVAHQVYNSDGTNVTRLSAMYRIGSKFSVVAGAFKDWNKGDLGADAKIVWKPFK